MFMEERQKEIVRAVEEKGRILVSEIQEKYGLPLSAEHGTNHSD